MKLFNDTPLLNAIWELTKKQYPELGDTPAPLTPIDGVSNLEKNEDVDYKNAGEYK